MRKILLSNGYVRIKHASLKAFFPIKNYPCIVQQTKGLKTLLSAKNAPNTTQVKTDQYNKSLILVTSITAASIIPTITICDEHPTKHAEEVVDPNDYETNNDDQEEYNEEDERSCPFCRFFLDSPCKETFIKWQQCVKVRY